MKNLIAEIENLENKIAEHKSEAEIESMIKSEISRKSKEIHDVARKIEAIASEIYEEDTALGSVMTISKEIAKDVLHLIETNKVR